MSLSPFKSDAAYQTAKASASSEPLSLSQALLITAGLAGLVGLCSGAIIRFSLSQSSETRFLSPLQTFPALSDWAPELPQGTADSHYLPGGAATRRNRDAFAETEWSDNQSNDFGPSTEGIEPTGQGGAEPEREKVDRDEFSAEDSYVEDSYIEAPYPEVEAPYSEEAPYYYENYDQP